jgi:acetolactate synthase-1/2/3 large subunit
MHHYTASDALLEALREVGVSYLFGNFGSDHPPIIEALAKAREQKKDVPKVIICPHETVALTAAHGYALLTGQPQCVMVHVDVGTQNLGGALHNVFRARVPVIIFAGETPFTMQGELRGTRSWPVNHIQDVFDQRGIVRSYVKWDYSIRTGKNVKQLIYRAAQLAVSDPKGPVYLTGAREVLVEEVEPAADTSQEWSGAESSSLPAKGVREIAEALANAQNPLIITSYLGRNPDAVNELIRLSETFAVPVVEQYSSYMNFPSGHPLHLGYDSGELVADADVVIVIDSDVPWMATGKKPAGNSKVFYIDVDPLKENIPLWNMPATRFYKADAYESLQRLNEYCRQIKLDDESIKARRAKWEKAHQEQRAKWREREAAGGEGVITPQYLTAAVREVIGGEAIVLNETITNSKTVREHLPRNLPGTFYQSGGSSLGWSGGAAIGAKLARPDKLVVSLTGDGSYLFGVPSSVYWIAKKYNTPFLTVIYNNQGWNATKQNVDALYPDGAAKKTDSYWVHFDQPADLAKIAEAAGGAFARSVDDPGELEQVLREGVREVKNGRSAVIDVRLPKISAQTD